MWLLHVPLGVAVGYWVGGGEEVDLPPDVEGELEAGD